MALFDDAWIWWSAERLLVASVQGALIVGLVWVICRRVSAIPASARALLWWLASLTLVATLLPLPSLPVPLLPAARVVTVPVTDIVASAPFVERMHEPFVSPSGAALSAPQQSPAPSRTVPFWLVVAIGLWSIGVAAHAVHLLVSYVRLRRTVRQSTPVEYENAAIVDRLARLIGLRVTPDVRVSDRIDTPLVAGMSRPVVLLPARALATLSPDERSMAICHELAHVRRRDLMLGWVPAIAERLFFFHPLARFAAREYAAEREAACDALVLQAMDVAPRDYGQMLLRLGVAGARPVFAVGGSSPSPSSLRRRLDMLHDVTFTRSGRGALALVAVMSAATLMPFRLEAQRPTVSEPAAAPVTPQVATPAEVPPTQTPPRAVLPVTPPKEAAPVRAPQPPKEARPVSPLPARADVEELQKAIAQQRTQMAETEKSLQEMRRALDRMLMQQERLRVRPVPPPRLAVAVDQVRGLQEEPRRVERERTEEFLESQLRAVKTEQERTSMMLRQLADQIEAIRRQLEQVQRAR